MLSLICPISHYDTMSTTSENYREVTKNRIGVLRHYVTSQLRCMLYSLRYRSRRSRCSPLASLAARFSSGGIICPPYQALLDTSLVFDCTRKCIHSE